jgi:regulator of nonsense transcripts 2
MDNDLEIQLDAMSQIETLKKEKEALLELRASNFPSGVQKFRIDHENNKKQLKSDLKKGTSFSKKIRVTTADNLQQCLKDIDSLNLTNYISEIVAAILDVGFKNTEIQMIVNISIGLHRRYEEFTSLLVSSIRDFLLQDLDDKESDKKKRSFTLFHIYLFRLYIFL